MTIWIDVEDLIRYFHGASRPTGIQRFSFQTYRAVWRQAGASGDVRFCRRNPGQQGFRRIHFPALEAGILAAGARAHPPVPTVARSASPLARAARRLPLQYRLPLGVLARAGGTAAKATRELALAPLRGDPARISGVGGHQFDLQGPPITFAPGDWLVNLGAPWTSPYNPELLGAMRAQGCGFALLAHDMIPALFPEWCTQTMVQDFSTWLTDVVPHADQMFAVSHNTAKDFLRCAAGAGKPAARPLVLPVGANDPAGQPSPRIQPNPYVLMVGTIEARKNHHAMMRVWRRLLEDLPRSAVPDLVFAGKLGWLTTDLLEQLRNAAWFGGKIRWVESPSEAQLANLYQHCEFSVFPSFYEGWGLPVTESLSHGKTVVASNQGAIPESGGEFCLYFDPDDTGEACALIRDLLENPARVAALEARIRTSFCPPAWGDTASALLAALGLAQQSSPAEQQSPYQRAKG